MYNGKELMGQFLMKNILTIWRRYLWFILPNTFFKFVAESLCDVVNDVTAVPNESDGVNATVEPLLTFSLQDPYFEPFVNKTVTARVGKSAYLSCKVKRLGNKSVNSENLFE